MPTKTGCIYKIENTVNGKTYIGQTTNIIDRWRNHYAIGKRGKSDAAMYRDMQTFGISAFTFQIVEDDIPVDQLDEKEQHYIAVFSSNKYGYNITAGGNHKSVKEKLTPEIVHDIINDIRNKIPFKQIAETYSVDRSTVSDINNGDTWHDENIDYPIVESNYKKKHFSDAEINDIYDRLTNHQTASSIAAIYNTTTTTISKINNGNIYARQDRQYPICKAATSPKHLEKDAVLAIANALATSTDNYVALAKKHHVGRKTISGINRGILYINHLTKNGYNSFPIRK